MNRPVPMTNTKIKISSDQETVKRIRNGLKLNDGYCPCEMQKTPDTKCMCKAFREQTSPGPCHCGLYVKEVIVDELHEQESTDK